MKKRRILYAVAALVVPLVVMAAGRWYVLAELRKQEARNAYLASQTAPLDEKLGELMEISRVKEQLLARMFLIETLSEARGDMISLMSDLSLVPRGITLERVMSVDRDLSIWGKASSPRHISATLRQLAKSPLLNEMRLAAGDAGGGKGLRVFTMTARVGRTDTDTDGTH